MDVHRSKKLIDNFDLTSNCLNRETMEIEKERTARGLGERKIF